MNNLPKVVAQQRRGRASNPRLLDRKSDALPLSHRATPMDGEGIPSPLTSPPRRLGCVSVSAESAPLARRLSPPPQLIFRSVAQYASFWYMYIRFTLLTPLAVTALDVFMPETFSTTARPTVAAFHRS